MNAPEPIRPADEHTDAVALMLDGVVAHRDNLAAMIRRLSDFLDGRGLNSWKHGACWAAEDAIKSLTARAESAEAEVVTLRARLAEAEALHWKVGGACSHCSQRSDYAVAWPCETAVALAGTTGEGE